MSIAGIPGNTYRVPYLPCPLSPPVNFPSGPQVFPKFSRLSFLRPDLFRRAFHFDTEPAGKSAWSGRRILDHLYGMHTFRGHPMATLPRAGVDRRHLAGDVANFTIGGMVAKVCFLAPCVVAQKYTRPAVGVHGFGRAGGRKGDMDDANECVLKNNAVTRRSCLDSIVAVGKCRLVLAEHVSVLGTKHKT
jgi:hypothetical protein